MPRDKKVVSLARQLGQSKTLMKSRKVYAPGRPATAARRPHARVSIELKIDGADLLRTVRRGDGSDWQKVKTFLNFLGFEPKFVQVHINRKSKINPLPHAHSGREKEQ